MAERFTVRDNAALGSITGTGPFLWSSADISREQGGGIEWDGLLLTFEWLGVVAAGTNPSIRINGVLEKKNAIGSSYSLIGYTFNNWSNNDAPRSDTIEAYPNLNWPDAGVPNALFIPAFQGNDQVSPQPIELPKDFRVCVVAKLDGDTTLTSLDVNIHGEYITKGV